MCTVKGFEPSSKGFQRGWRLSIPSLGCVQACLQVGLILYRPFLISIHPKFLSFSHSEIDTFFTTNNSFHQQKNRLLFFSGCAAGGTQQPLTCCGRHHHQPTKSRDPMFWEQKRGSQIQNYNSFLFHDDDIARATHRMLEIVVYIMKSVCVIYKISSIGTVSPKWDKAKDNPTAALALAWLWKRWGRRERSLALWRWRSFWKK